MPIVTRSSPREPVLNKAKSLMKPDTHQVNIIQSEEIYEANGLLNGDENYFPAGKIILLSDEEDSVQSNGGKRGYNTRRRARVEYDDILIRLKTSTSQLADLKSEIAKGIAGSRANLIRGRKNLDLTKDDDLIVVGDMSVEKISLMSDEEDSFQVNEGHNTRRKIDKDLLNQLKNLKSQLTDLLNSKLTTKTSELEFAIDSSIYTGIYVSSCSKNHQTQAFDYTLSDGTMGRIHQDFSTIVIIDSQKSNVTLDKVSESAVLHSYLEVDEATIMVYMSGNLQIDFDDSTKVILSPTEKSITLVDELEKARSFKFDTIKSKGCLRKITMKLSFAKNGLDRVLSRVM